MGGNLTVVDGNSTIKIGEEDHLRLSLHVRENGGPHLDRNLKKKETAVGIDRGGFVSYVCNMNKRVRTCVERERESRREEHLEEPKKRS